MIINIRFLSDDDAHKTGDYHPDYPGILKPMGAWGGDFFLAFGPPEDTRNYFESKGFFPVWQAKEVMLNY